jgi:multicomponent Na+:H+ antiporter subunit F
MNQVFQVAAVAAMALSIPYLWRVVVGPGVLDRLVALNGMGSKIPVVVVLVGLSYERADMFVDIALGIFLLNLVTTLLVAKFVKEKGSL